MIRRLLLAASLLLVLTGSYLGLAYQAFHRTELPLEPGAKILVERGDTVRSVLQELEARGATRYDWRWRLLNRLHPVTIRAGEYALEPGLRPQQLLDLLASGQVVQYALTIVEGWTYARLREALEADPVLESGADLGDAELMEALGMPGMHPEGWFLPETYHFARGDSAFELLRRAHAAMGEALERAWHGRDDVPLSSPYELLILASIIEKETAVASERARIAGVFARRLRQNWRLETDPTVIYGLGSAFDGDLRTRDLRTDTPYNTYTRRGLPPTPIALPGEASLMAAARPEPGTAMFFVADGRGGHVFSDTLAEHNEAVKRMLKRQP